MAIDFACPTCGKQFRVKSELAGKTAKCAGCQNRLRIPAAKSRSQATRNAPANAPANASANVASSKTKPDAAAGLASSDMSSWLDDELEAAPTSAAPTSAAPKKSRAKSAADGCPTCGAALPSGAVICVACGFDRRSGGQHTTEVVNESDESDAPAKSKKRGKVGFAGSLMRGSLFSFIGAMLGALLWGALVWLTMREFAIVAWGLGGLAGLGMAIGHEDDDGTFAGIIAAFMSLVGIVAAKIFAVVFLVASMISQVAGVIDAEFADPDSPEGIRQALTWVLIEAEMDKLEDSDEFPDLGPISEQAKQQVSALSDDQVAQRLEALTADEELDLPPTVEEGAESDGPINGLAENGAAADGGADNSGENQRAGEDQWLADDSGAVVVEDFGVEEEPGLGFGDLFGPIDGLFILLAFFTAYKVGSGEIGD